MTRIAIIAAACAALGTGAGQLTLPASGGSTAATTVDRTFVCTAGYGHGARTITTAARSAYGSDDVLEWLAQATVTTPGSPLPKREHQPTLAGMTTGWPPPPPLTSGALAFENARCGPTRARVPLSRAGLEGGAVGVFGDEVTCITAKTVLIRIRATFRSPVALEPSKDGRFISVSGRILTGKLAARTPTGTQLVYADVTESGKARLFTNRRCS